MNYDGECDTDVNFSKLLRPNIKNIYYCPCNFQTYLLSCTPYWLISMYDSVINFWYVRACVFVIVFVRVFVFMYVCVCVCIYLWVCVSVCVWLCIFSLFLSLSLKYKQKHNQTNIRKCYAPTPAHIHPAHTHIYYKQTHINSQTHSYTNIHIHKQTHTQLHTNNHKYTHINIQTGTQTWRCTQTDNLSQHSL